MEFHSSTHAYAFAWEYSIVSLPVFAFPPSLDRLVLCTQNASSKENQKTMLLRLVKYLDKMLCKGPVRESNQGPLAP